MKTFCLKSIAFATLCAAGLSAGAQTDVTKYYLSNYGFDSDFDYPKTYPEAVSQEINNIPGWTSELSANYTVAGTFEFGYKYAFNNAYLPSTGYDGETTGGGLGLSTGWSQTFCLYQDITLPAGTYTVYVPSYNGKSASAGTSLLAWIPSKGTSVTSSTAKYAAKAWTNDSITFTLKSSTSGKLQIGYKAGAGSSTSSANLFIDYVKIVGENMTVRRTNLLIAIRSANRLYGDGTGTGAADLKTAIDEAQTVYNNTSVTMPDVLEATYQLNQAIEVYQYANVSEDNPIDYTDYIVNPSFETDGTAYWTSGSLSTQTNSVFSKKDGDTYMEKWTSIGGKVGKAYIKQTLKKLPVGNYILTAAGLNIQQSGSNSLINKGDAQTGAWIYAGSGKTAITAMADYSVKFSVLDEGSEVEVGMKAENATGNYLCVDNFRLYYTGALTDKSYALEVNNLVEQGEELIAKGIQQADSTKLKAAIDLSKEALKGTVDDDNNVIYDIEALDSARTAMTAALTTAQASRERYETLQTRIDYAEKVLGWWQGTESKQKVVTYLSNQIEKAHSQMNDHSLSNLQLTTAVKILNSRIAAVDKDIYYSGSAVGSESALANASNQYCTERSMQSKHWVLYWESGYGSEAPSAVEDILNTADKIFELYADSLKFITINQGKSRTDKYKMIIRLLYTGDWVANGSGIDNTIGMLTLSRWAYTSRGGQTAAHEIGHCFQYQTHCDNGNYNGWMYTWANSGNGNVFWEMCAQWQAYKFYPRMQFEGNEWLYSTLNGLNKHPLAEELRYNNFFIQDFFCHKHGVDIIGKLWNKSENPEDPFQAYMRLTMDSNLSDAQKLENFNNEMWEYGARMTTFDCDLIRNYGASTIGTRNQTDMTLSDGWWSPTAADCIENFGNNAIRLNVPTKTKTVYAQLTGEAGKSGYISYNVTKAGWKYGFVALKKDGTRLYGDIATATYANPEGEVVAFECPSDCKYLWLVVSGAPTSYWSRGWNGTTADDEQWPYKVKFYYTNKYGNDNNNEDPTGISEISDDAATANQANAVYSISGQLIRSGSTSLEGLPKGIYIVGGKKIVLQ